ncbi:MAG: 50S ribosomal protein L19 [Chloroflexi bacterium]|nr:50S ribosomal protein L19 [Chloroflexota bacterium]MBM3172277.1 50S ribosomal protein L19 [Chloroflexota bacterium]MBM3174749.1 50S ribosomal protein L19 [Chloroflexota bacterium]MBM4449840.1 50S ribosomal protein L19 [Chloroflexota bacterium]
MDIRTINLVKANPNIPVVSPGDTVKVSYRVKEANRERVQNLSGLVVRVRRGTGGGSFTIRRVSNAVGVEHTFPFASPMLEKVEVVRHSKVRRAKLYYIRRLSAKEARLKERREKIAEEAAVAQGEALAEDTGIVAPVAAGGVAEEAAPQEAAKNSQ